jgi:hypothetical protein
MHRRIIRPSLLPAAGIKNFFVAAAELASALPTRPSTMESAAAPI